MKYTLITGASGGIGLELAKLCAKNKHNLILVARNEKKLQEIKSKLEKEYMIRAEVIAANLSEVDAASALYAKTTSAGYEVNILINNAGYGDHSAFLDSDWKRQYEMVQLNITAMMQLTYLYGNDMRKNGSGRILNLSSVAAFSAGPYMSIYYATKNFVLSFSLSVAEELKGSGVTVTAICPGPTSTGFESAAQMHGSKMFTFFKPQSAEAVAKCAYCAMMEGKPLVYHSSATKFMNVGARLTTRKFAGRFAKKINQKPEGSR